MPSHFLKAQETVFLVCDIQTKFQNAIHAWPHVVAVASKMLRFAEILGVPVVTTEQNPKALGPTDPGVGLASLPAHLNFGVFPKTKFSMVLPDTAPLLAKAKAVAIFGIESHICVTQTVLELLETRPDVTVYVISDGCSSCNKEEIPIALARLRAAGAQVTTSESFLFQLQHDSGTSTFKPFSKAVKEVMPVTSAALQAILGDGEVGAAVGSKL